MEAATLTRPCLHREVIPPRRCSVVGCETWLASRNPTDECSEHGGWRELATLNEQRVALEDLMAEAT